MLCARCAAMEPEGLIVRSLVFSCSKVCDFNSSANSQYPVNQATASFERLGDQAPWSSLRISAFLNQACTFQNLQLL